MAIKDQKNKLDENEVRGDVLHSPRDTNAICSEDTDNPLYTAA